MVKNKFRITEKDFLLANRKSKKVYDRKRLKKAGIKSDDLPFSYWSLTAGSKS